MTVLAIFLISSGLAVLALTPSAWQRLLRFTLSPVRTVAGQSAASPGAQAPLPQRLSRDVQWDRASEVVAQSIARAATVRDLQRSAGQQLDSATYAIQRLFEELSGVMTIEPITPAFEAATAQVVHPFTPSAQRRGAAEAIAA